MSKNITKLFCSNKTTIKQVLNKFESASENNLPSGIALFLNDKNALTGVITEGDIRRALLKGANLDSTAQSYMTSSPIVLILIKVYQKFFMIYLKNWLWEEESPLNF